MQSNNIEVLGVCTGSKLYTKQIQESITHTWNWDLVPHHANPAGAVHAPTHVMPASAGSSSRATQPLDQQYVWVGPPTINATTRAKNNSRKTFVS